MRGILYKDETLGADYESVDLPEEVAAEAHKMREQMVEAVAETDDVLLEKYLSGEEVTEDEIVAALRRATIANRLQPVVCGSAFKNKGVQPLLDAVVDYLPSPLDVPPIQGLLPGTDHAVTRPADDGAPFSALVFKIMTDPFVGQLAYFRVYSGHVESGSSVLNVSRGKQRAHRPPAQDARQQARGDLRGVGGRHRRRGRAEERHHRRHHLRPQGRRSCSRR